MALFRVPPRLAALNQSGTLNLLWIQASKYSTEREKKVNLAAWKRGTGGRCSFNGVVCTVFGATGFMGEFLVNQLGKTGTQIIIPYRTDHYYCMPLKVSGDLGQVLFHNFHLRDQQSIETAVKHSNVVINLIGRDYETKNFKFDDVHVEGIRNIARACKKMGVDRLIHMSYLNSAPDPEPLVMKEPSGFKISKWNGEQALMEEFPDATILKASDIYGQGDRFLRAFSFWYRKQGQYLPLYKNGADTEKQPVFVSDVCKGLVNIMKDPDTKGQIYQAVGPKRYNLGVLVDYIHKVLRRDEKWGYFRYDMKYDPLFSLRVTINEKLSPAWPLGFLHWEGLEREATSDLVLKALPTLEDLGVTLTHLEDQIFWELKPFRAYNYFMETVGDFERPADPPTVNIDLK